MVEGDERGRIVRGKYPGPERTSISAGTHCPSFKEDHSTSDASAAELGLANVGGVFVVLALGCAFGFIMAVLEFVWNIRKIAVEEEVRDFRLVFTDFFLTQAPAVKYG